VPVVKLGLGDPRPRQTLLGDLPRLCGAQGSVAHNATVTLGVAALARPLAVGGIVVPAIAAAFLPVALLVVTPGGRLKRLAGAVLVLGYVVWVTAVLAS